MADTSMSEVTITLGRIGQVVKRTGALVNSNSFDPIPVVGSKRSVRDRLGSSFNESHLSKEDLRFKIMKKTQSNHTKNHSLQNPRNGGQSAHQISPESRDDRNRIPEQNEGRLLMSDQIEVEKHIQNSMRTSEALSPWTFDHIRHRSPPPPPPSMAEESQRTPIMRTYNDPIQLPYASGDVSDITRSMMTSSFPIKPPMKPVLPLVNFQLPVGKIVQQTQHPVEHLTLEGFLHSLGLHKYVISFRIEEVDMATLSHMGEHDLKELGIPMGPRKKILMALLARTRRQNDHTTPLTITKRY